MLGASTLPGRTIVVGDLEGGTGKSTIAVNLAAALVSKGCRVALVDTDPSGTAYDWISRGLLPLNCFHEPVEDQDGSEAWLDTMRALTRGHDFVVVDLAAAMPWSLGAAYLSGDVILVPTSPGRTDDGHPRRAVVQARKARSERPELPPKVIFVPNRVVHDDPSWLAVERWLEEQGEAIGPTIGPHAEHRLACARGDWAGGVAPFSRAHLEVQLLADAALLALGIPTIALQPPDTHRRCWPADGLTIVAGGVAVRTVEPVSATTLDPETEFRMRVGESLLRRMFRR